MTEKEEEEKTDKASFINKRMLLVVQIDFNVYMPE